MKSPEIQSVYSVADFESLGFHDGCVHGIRWDCSVYALILDLDYIVQWIKNSSKFEFWVAPAEIRFDYSSEVKMTLDWTNLPMQCQIHEIGRRDVRLGPNGSECYRWDIAFNTPRGSIELWASDFELKIQAEPVLSNTQRLRGGW